MRSNAPATAAWPGPGWFPASCRRARSTNENRRQIAAGLGLSTVVDYERGRRVVAQKSIDAMRAALEAAGVIFVDENGHGPGVRLRKR